MNALLNELHSQFTQAMKTWKKPSTTYKRQPCNASFRRDEYKLLLRAAQKAKITPSAHLRQIAIAHFASRRVPLEELSPIRAKIRRLATQLRRLDREHEAQALFDIEQDLMALIEL